MVPAMVQVQTFVNVISATRNLTQALSNASADLFVTEGLFPMASHPRGSGPGRPGPRGNRPIGPNSPGPNGPGPGGPPPGMFAAEGCSEGGFKLTGKLANQGLNTAVPQLSYDNALFSYVGCRCAAGYDNVYNLEPSGKQNTPPNSTTSLMPRIAGKP